MEGWSRFAPTIARMSLPRVVAVAPGSAAARAGLLPGDELLSVGGQVPRDVIQYQLLTAEAEVEVEVDRGGLQLTLTVEKDAGETLGAEVSSALFDRIRTCDNHCEFCFIYQLHAQEPVRQGRRLPAVLPLRELHDPHPLHRGRPRTGGHRTPQPPLCEHPRHRPRRASRHAAQPERGDQPALVAGPAGARHRGARADRGVPRHQRRRRAGRHAHGCARPLRRPGLAGGRAAGRQPLLDRGIDADTLGPRGGRGRRPGRGVAGRLPRRARPPPGVRGRRVLPPSRPALPRRRALRGVPDDRGRHRPGSLLRAGAPR